MKQRFAGLGFVWGHAVLKEKLDQLSVAVLPGTVEQFVPAKHVLPFDHLGPCVEELSYDTGIATLQCILQWRRSILTGHLNIGPVFDERLYYVLSAHRRRIVEWRLAG